MSEFMPENIEQHGPRQAEKRNDPEQDAERKKPELLRGPESVPKSRNGKTAEKCTGQNPRRRNQKERYDLLKIANGYDPLGLGAAVGPEVPFSTPPFPIFHVSAGGFPQIGEVHDKNVGRSCREVDGVQEIAVFVEVGFEEWNACYVSHHVFLFISRKKFDGKMTPTENIEGFHLKVSRTEKELSRTLIENGTCASRADPEKQFLGFLHSFGGYQ